MNILRFDSTEIVHDVNTVLTVGTFDGLHAGHMEILRRMKAMATQMEGRTVVVTFEPHPQIVLAKPDREPVKLLTTLHERCVALEDAGVDTVVVIPFTKAFAAIDADTFVRTVCNTIGVRDFFVGHDHNFGKNRDGNEDLLRKLGSELGFTVHHVDALDVDGVVVSSTKIRHALQGGDVELAAMLIGRPYSVTGIVVHGDARGRTIGYPTANITVESEFKLLPQNGVYVVSALIHGKHVFGMANVGTRPTFTLDTKPSVEVHFLDTHMDLYGQQLTVLFLKRLREELKFESLEALINQIHIDEQQTRNNINNIYKMES